MDHMHFQKKQESFASLLLHYLLTALPVHLLKNDCAVRMLLRSASDNLQSVTDYFNTPANGLIE
jgi:hypothetical protein